MKVLRIVHGMANNIMDVQVPDAFNLGMWALETNTMGYVCIGDFYVNRQWIQHAAVLTEERASELHAQGMTKQ